MKTLDIIAGIIIVISVIYTSYTFGYNDKQVEYAQISPVSDLIEFSDYKSDYRISIDSKYRTERITEGNEEYWFIYLWDGSRNIVIEYEDTLIDGEITTAAQWKDSFIMCLGGLK